MWLRPRTVRPMALLVLAMTLVAAPVAAATGTEKTLYAFRYAPNGSNPLSGVVFDPAGNLYGTTSGTPSYPGVGSYGTVFELSPLPGGVWTQTRRYRFLGGTDGGTPDDALVMDRAGNVYGTAFYGGTFNMGVVFRFHPTAGGGWTETILHNFTGGSDGAYPVGGLVFDGAGNLYGTTSQGGSSPRCAGSCGTVFELAHAGGTWTETILHSFDYSDGDGPTYGSLVFDRAGNLYGTTVAGGSVGYGVTFELSPSGGAWTETVLHSFTDGVDGALPGGVTLDQAGNIYGVASGGGDIHGAGLVYELLRPHGVPTERVLYTFKGGIHGAPDGYGPGGGSVTFDQAGNLYGTTTLGGTYDSGTVYKLAPATSGPWSETVLHSFGSSPTTEGYQPWAGVIRDAAGNLYGTTTQGIGGCYGLGCGMVFEVTP